MKTVELRTLNEDFREAGAVDARCASRIGEQSNNAPMGQEFRASAGSPGAPLRKHDGLLAMLPLFRNARADVAPVSSIRKISNLQTGADLAVDQNLYHSGIR